MSTTPIHDCQQPYGASEPNQEDVEQQYAYGDRKKRDQQGESQNDCRNSDLQMALRQPTPEGFDIQTPRAIYAKADFPPSA
mmetsp:Transcript_32838/g.60086  ORF Transcript_32838/g.60086 Transcript_32838/m.60086 type:complete len:81 (+) Transcript_32838:759-1001(+)